MVKKAIIFDSGSLINFSMNGILYIIEKLKKEFEGKFLITKDIEYETIKHPLKIKKYELGGLKIKELLDKGIIEMPETLGINSSGIKHKTKDILRKSNHLFFSKRPIHLIDRGEASCLVLSEILQEKNIENVIVVDERTTRMLCESPENLHKLMEKKLNTKIKTKKEHYPYFKKFKIIRSSELVYIAYKKNLVKLGNGSLLDALLYAIKYKGCSISKQEIDQIKKL
jgi:hypothetical protein